MSKGHAPRAFDVKKFNEKYDQIDWSDGEDKSIPCHELTKQDPDVTSAPPSTENIQTLTETDEI